MSENLCNTISAMIRTICILLIIKAVTLFCNESADSVAVADSSKFISPIKSHGSLSGNSSTFKFDNISKKQLPTINYADNADILKIILPCLPLNMGTLGEMNSVTSFGTMPGQIQTSYNGRNVTDVFLQAGNLNYFSPENFENLEIFTGSDAAIFSFGSGILINRQQIIYNTKSPYTKLQYVQSGSDFLSLDAIYAHNLSNKINFDFGFRTQAGDRELANSEYSSWNVRGSMRYNYDSTLNISLTENFTNHKIEHSGGTLEQTNSDMYDEITTSTLFSTAREQVFRHDLTATFTKDFEGNGSRVLLGNAFFSNSNFENRLDSNLIISDVSSDGFYDFSSLSLGLNLQYCAPLTNRIKYNLGLDYSYSETDASPLFHANLGSTLAAFIRGELLISTHSSISFGGRVTSYESDQYFSGGARIKYTSRDSSMQTAYFNVGLDASISSILPNIYTLPYNFKHEIHIPIIANIEYISSDFSLAFYGFYRTINNPVFVSDIANSSDKIQIAYSQSNKQQIYGGTVKIDFPLYSTLRLCLSNTSQFSSISSKKAESFPAIFANADISYSMQIGRSEFKAGINCTFFSKYKAMQFVPFFNAYLQTDTYNESHHDGLNIYGVARLGSAFVKVSLDNVFGKDFYFLSLYPMQGRILRLSVHWDFFN